MLMSCIKGASGDGGAWHTESGTTSPNQTVTINTGLSSIKNFVLVSSITSSTDVYEVFYSSDNSANYYSAMMRGTTTYGGLYAIGSGTPAVQAWKVASVSGGTIVLNSPNHETHGIQDNISWTAE